MKKLGRVNSQARVLKLEIQVFEALCVSVDTPRSLACFMLAKAGEWMQLINLRCNPDHYTCPDQFSVDYLVTESLKKNPRLPLPIDKKTVALNAFIASEQKCRETNDRFLSLGADPSPHYATLERHRAQVSRVLGPLTTRSLNRIEEAMRFGPGATTSLTGIVTQGRKFSTRVLDTTSRLLAPFLLTKPVNWPITDIRVRRGSRLTTVPKNAKTDRVICIEPDLNIFVQLGIGTEIRERLKRSGIDLNDQTRNQELAQKAYSQSLATIDLKAASDTISFEVVKMLLPHRWFELLVLPRCDYTEIDGEYVALEKFSSMGNGFTFELESLIFFTAILAVCGENVDLGSIGTYGDDLIVPQRYYHDVIDYLEFLGFEVNREKSFGEGLFFESCGCDFFMGINVRPFYLRSTESDPWKVAYGYANRIREYAHNLARKTGCDSRLLPPWLRCFSSVPESRRFLIPMGFGDTGFSADFEIARPKGNEAIFGYSFRYYHIPSQRAVISEQGCLTASLSRPGLFGSDNISSSEFLRGRFKRAVTRVGHTSVWPDLGPWL